MPDDKRCIPVNSFGFVYRAAEFCTEIHTSPQPQIATAQQPNQMKAVANGSDIDRTYPLYDYDFKRGVALDEEKTVVGNVEKRLLGKWFATAEMSEADYERLLVAQAERAAARLRASRVRKGPAPAETPGDAKVGSGTPKTA